MKIKVSADLAGRLRTASENVCKTGTTKLHFRFESKCSRISIYSHAIWGQVCQKQASRAALDRWLHPTIFVSAFVACFWHTTPHIIRMMTSSNGNIFRVTGHLCVEFTGPGEFPAQRPVTLSFDVFFDLRLNKPLSKQSWGWWFETQSSPLWRHCNGY